MGESNNEDVVIEKQKIIRMVNRIYALERDNTKTAKRNEKEMKAEIERIIEEEAKKCY
jgi:septal ring factor EnvC (AmiA/AmiB activator)